MIKDEFGQFIYNELELHDGIMQGIDMLKNNILVNDINIPDINAINELLPKPVVVKYAEPSQSVEEFDTANQENWFMPDEYKKLDIAKCVLDLCTTQDQLQRCGDELLKYQERNLFNLLKYLKYLVDLMKKHNIIWGVGRGSSVSSYVLFKLEVHRVDSMFYNLDIDEFLR